MGAEIPWLTIQLNRRLAYEDGLPFDEGWGTIREAQRQAARKIPGISIVPAIDCSLSDGIHNTAAANVVLGERLAAAALRDIYHRSWSHPAPDLESAVLTAPDVMELTFSPVAGRIYGYDSVLVDRNAFTVWSGDKALSIKQRNILIIKSASTCRSRHKSLARFPPAGKWSLLPACRWISPPICRFWLSIAWKSLLFLNYKT